MSSTIDIKHADGIVDEDSNNVSHGQNDCPMDLVPQEILQMIASIVYCPASRPPCIRRDLYSCIRVSKRFYSAFLPFFYRTLSLCNAPHGLIPAVSIRLHHHFVRSLYLIFDSSGLFPGDLNTVLQHLPRLEYLESQPLRNSTLDSDRFERVETIITLLLHQHATLKRLFLMDCHSPYSSQLLRHKITLWHAVSGLKQLSTLKIQVAHIQSTENLTWFWKICTLPSLQALTLQRVILEDLDHDIMVNEDIDQHQQEQQQQQSWQIRHLTIKRVHGDDQSIARLFELLGRSPKLCSLVWESFGSKAFRLPHYAFLPLAQGFRDSTYFWPTTIRKLYIQCDSVEDSDMAAILSTASGGGARLTELVFENGAFGDRSLTALLQNHHTETLTHVDLHKSITTGQVTHSVLCTCPRLVSIHGVKMSVNLDILPDNRPWVCEDLEEWHVAIEMDDDKETDPNTEEVETQQQQITFEIFSRLSNLKKIRKLDLESRFYRLPPTRRPQRDLPFRLDWGMDQLESLQNLELLTINETRGNILTDDLWSWLMSTFPRLRMVSGIDVHRGEMDLEFWRYRLEDSR